MKPVKFTLVVKHRVTGQLALREEVLLGEIIVCYVGGENVILKEAFYSNTDDWT